jgi:predicted ATP-binding protein involved in virulence
LRGNDFRHMIGKPTEGTYESVFENFQSLPYKWRNSKGSNIILMVGDVGCGKTTLDASITDSLEAYIRTHPNSTSSSLCCFFFKDDGKQRSSVAILRGLLHQMASQDKDLLRQVRDSKNSRTTLNSPHHLKPFRSTFKTRHTISS